MYTYIKKNKKRTSINEKVQKFLDLLSDQGLTRPGNVAS